MRICAYTSSVFSLAFYQRSRPLRCQAGPLLWLVTMDPVDMVYLMMKSMSLLEMVTTTGGIRSKLSKWASTVALSQKAQGKGASQKMG